MIERPTFRQFVEYSAIRQIPLSAWVYEPGIRLYVRKGWHERQGDFVLANMQARRPGKGALTKFLDNYETVFQFSVENILNPRLVPYFERRGYVRNDLPGMGAPHMIGPHVSPRSPTSRP